MKLIISETATPIVELGNALLTNIPRRNEGSIPQSAKEVLEKEIAQTKEMLDNLKDMHYVEDFHVIEGPIMDTLARYRHFGWYGRIASPGYMKLQEHFRCQRGHYPDSITWKFIWSLSKKLWVRRVELLKQRIRNWWRPDEDNGWS